MKIEERNFELISDEIVQVLKKKSPAERMEIAFDICKTVQTILENHIRFLHPKWTNQEIKKELARRISGGS
ncbi:MAG: hypothetical protein A2Y62_19350 [Candidatus Fischerbacteria bacterium RBG_13_37_8]|uniref:Uncharacterized protein n=1 Tax=Candidatus Fischerbacteria bacterium RBG_13_37_8 TaxID=1817863 RepID=A0A1F5VX58_9BACT|nr:MAG: hypothetical protein A2Y62_19350 [Candidatus Fischerbacteria bacterium RBG_13_37_8]